MEDTQLFYRDTWVEIDLDCIYENVSSMKNLLPANVALFVAVKANAYGHGDVQTAKTALDAGASYLAVAFLDEALALRNRGISAPILVLGASRPQDVNLAAKNGITLTVFQEDWIVRAGEVLDPGAKLAFHVKLDTGMGRIGIRSKEELQAVEALIAADNRFLFEGIYTHFATADGQQTTYFYQQLSRFTQMVSWLANRPRYVHCSNSAAALRFPKSYFNAVRMGIAMYGLSPSLEMEPELPFPLREAFSLHSRLSHVKKLQKGDKVSYGATYEAERDEWIGTLPIGYADGWIRRLQGQEVLVDGIRVPIIGRICMDQCMVKLPYHVPVGTTVTLIGFQKQETISVNEIAKKLDTINYEIPCLISNRVPRIFKQGGKTVDSKNALLQN